MKLKRPLLFTLLALGALCAQAATLDLSGPWKLQLDPKDQGLAAKQWSAQFSDTISLPGTTTLAGKGTPLDIPINLDRPAMQSLHQRFSYVGPAWYQRSVAIPADWKERDIELSLERVNWQTRVWVNGVEAGPAQRSLSAPHRFDLTKLLQPGAENILTIRVDNREIVPIGVMGHAYTNETQSIWNGLVGQLRLDAKPKLRVQHLRLRSDLTRYGVKATLTFVNHTGAKQTAPVVLSVANSTAALKREVTIAPGESTQEFFLELPADTALWSEFTPVTHAVTATLGAGDSASAITDSFGLRSFKSEGRFFTINGQRTFLRGTVECAQFPLTGHPDVVGAQWEKIFTTARAYGLNHLRFHSYCPPKAAFVAADRLGFYLHVELPNWTFKMGQSAPVDEYFEEEAQRIFREYGNHPSFVMLSLGNELTGDLDKMDAFVVRLRKLEPDILFTSTTFAFSPRGKTAGPQDDFFISQETTSGWVRGQGFINNTKPTTDSDYAPGMSSVPIPLVTHEVGQYVVYPNLAELPKYDSTPFRATAWEAIAADLKAKGRLNEAADYTRASGALAVLLYKEDLERALRTKDLAGIQLLQLQDFAGQSTATVGLLDVFWDSKGLITPEAFREFCSPTVPLIRMPKMVFNDDETFEATVELAHFGPAPLLNASVSWKIHDGATLVGQGTFTAPKLPLGNGLALGRIKQPLSGVKHAAKLTVTVEIDGTAARNRWNIWVYPKASASTEKPGVVVFEKPDDTFYQALRDGKNVLLLPPRSYVKQPIDGRFIPVFWSPLHFPNQPGTLGAWIDPAHPVWADFPTDAATDWQWWELLSKSHAVNLENLGAKLAMPFRFVDKYNRNAVPAGLFEARVGPGKLFVCTLDVSENLDRRIVARQLRRSILGYMAGDRFAPKGQLVEADLKGLFTKGTYKLRASSEHDGYAANLAADGNLETIWHSEWENGAKLPASLEMDLGSEQLIRGFRCTPRQDKARPRIARYTTEISVDGKTWRPWGKPGEFANDKNEQTVRFPEPVRARYLRLNALSAHGNAPTAAVAEFAPIAEELSADVRDLGIVPGFNDKK